jgi:hypothetical protein
MLNISPDLPSPDEAIRAEVFTGNFKKFLAILSLSLNTKEGLNRCLLFAAAAQGRGNFSDVLKVAGADKKYYLNGRLNRAACVGDIEKINKYVSQGADIHHENDAPLWSALSCMQEDAARHLVDLGCNFSKAATPQKIATMAKLYGDKEQEFKRFCLTFRTKTLSL